MAALPDFELLRPATLAEAVALIAAPGARVLAGGTDLVPNLRRGLEQPTRLIDVTAVPGMTDFREEGGTLVLGAGVTLARLAADGGLAVRFPAIAEAAAAVAGPGHRTVATVGGNLCLDTRCVFYNQSAWWRAANDHCLKRGGDTCHVAPQGERCHAAFSADLAPALIALGAEVDLQSVRGARRLPLSELYRDDGADALTKSADELLLRVRVPAPRAGMVSAYRKARVRGAMDFPLAGVACAMVVDGTVLAGLQIAFTGTHSRPFLLDGSAAWIGSAVDEPMQAAIARLVQQQVHPMRSTVTASNHRRLVAMALTRRLIDELWHRAQESAPCG